MDQRRSDEEAGRTLLTIIDSDTAFAADYFAAATYKFASSRPSHERARMMLMPMICFDRNANKVPITVRVTDIVWSLVGMSTLYEGCLMMEDITIVVVVRAIRDIRFKLFDTSGGTHVLQSAYGTDKVGHLSLLLWVVTSICESQFLSMDDWMFEKDGCNGLYLPIDHSQCMTGIIEPPRPADGKPTSKAD